VKEAGHQIQIPFSDSISVKYKAKLLYGINSREVALLGGDSAKEGVSGLLVT